MAQPQSVVHLSSQDDLENKFKLTDVDAYYVLDNDITIDDEYFFAPHWHARGHTRRPGPHHHLR